jgi:hypothetical protein
VHALSELKALNIFRPVLVSANILGNWLPRWSRALEGIE